MNRIKKYSFLIAGLLLAATLTSCVKNRNDLATDFSNLKPIIEFRTPETNNVGLAYFSKAALFLTDAEPDTVTMYVNIASVNALSKDLSVTVDVNDAAISAYNSGSDIQYEKMPDSTFELLQNQVTIPAGSHVGTVDIVFEKGKIDPTKNYMLPISITDASGENISGNFGTIYWHTIGNPLAGAYLWDFTRWGNPQQSGDPDIVDLGEPTTFSPVSPTQVEVASGYYIQPRYELTFSDDNGVLSDFHVILNKDDVDAMAANGVIVTNGPNIMVADPVNKVFEFQYTTLTRYVIDKYYKP